MSLPLRPSCDSSFSSTVPPSTAAQAPAAKKAKAETPAAAVDPNASCTVFVGNMAWGTDEASLRSAFADVGKVTSVRVGEFRELVSASTSALIPW